MNCPWKNPPLLGICHGARATASRIPRPSSPVMRFYMVPSFIFLYHVHQPVCSMVLVYLPTWLGDFGQGQMLSNVGRCSHTLHTRSIWAVMDMLHSNYHVLIYFLVSVISSFGLGGNNSGNMPPYSWMIWGIWCTRSEVFIHRATLRSYWINLHPHFSVIVIGICGVLTHH